MSARPIFTTTSTSSSTSPSAPLIPLPPIPSHERRDERQRRLERLHGAIRSCEQCVVSGYLRRADGVAGTRGRIGDQLMLVGQAPGHLSVTHGIPFSGPSGKLLDQWLTRAGFPPGALRSQVYLTAMTRCDPGKSPRGNGDRKPSPPELALCRPYLLRELELVRPRAIMLVGGMAIEAFLGPSRLDEIVGASVELNGVNLLPMPHPSGVSRWLNDPAHQALVTKALALLTEWRRTWEIEESNLLHNQQAKLVEESTT